MDDEPSKIEQAERMAYEAVNKDLDPQYQYKFNTSDGGDVWMVVILPTGRVRGGGARVTVSKEPMEIQKVVYLQ